MNKFLSKRQEPDGLPNGTPQTERPAPDNNLYGRSHSTMQTRLTTKCLVSSLPLISPIQINNIASHNPSLTTSLPLSPGTDLLFPGDFAFIFNNPLFSKECVYCVNLHHPLDNNALATVGVAKFQMGSQYEWRPTLDGVTVPGTEFSDLMWCKQEH